MTLAQRTDYAAHERRFPSIFMAGSLLAIACGDPPPGAGNISPPSGSAEPATQVLELPGVRMQVPASYVRADALGKSSRDRTSETTTVVMTHPGGVASGAVQVQRVSVPLSPIAGVRTVKQALHAQAQISKEMLSSPPRKIVQFDVSAADKAIKTCAESHAPDQPPFRNCTLSYVSPDQQLVSLAGVCLLEDAAACTKILGSLAFEPGTRLALDAELAFRTTTETKALEVPGVSVNVSALYEALPEPELKRFKESRAKPGSQVDVAVRRSPTDLPSALVLVERISTPLTPNRDKKVRSLIEAAAKRYEAELADEGMEVVSTTMEPKDDAIEHCTLARDKQGQSVFERQTCNLMYVTAKREVVTLRVLCHAELPFAEEACGPLMKSRKHEPGERLSLDAALATAR